MKEEFTGDRTDWWKAVNNNATVSEKSWWTTFWLSLFFGCFGADRFYLGRTGLGIIKLITFGGSFWWWIIDFCLLLTGKMKDGEGRFVRYPKRS
jgi:TM2 domain-containing membrane protein YozV